MVRKLPGFQNRIDVLVQAEPAVLNGPERRHRRQRLADRRRLLQGVVRRRGAGIHVGDAPGFRSVHLEIADHRQADSGHMKTRHQLLKGQWFGALTKRDLRALNRRDEP